MLLLKMTCFNAYFQPPKSSKSLTKQKRALLSSITICVNPGGMNNHVARHVSIITYIDILKA